MYRTLTTVALTVLAVLFAIQNFEHVPLYFFWGKPVQIRLIFVITDVILRFEISPRRRIRSV